MMVCDARGMQGRNIAVGDHIPYVICRGSQPTIAERAYHPDEVLKSGGDLQIDTEWYIAQQVRPFVWSGGSRDHRAAGGTGSDGWFGIVGDAGLSSDSAPV